MMIALRKQEDISVAYHQEDKRWICLQNNEFWSRMGEMKSTYSILVGKP